MDCPFCGHDVTKVLDTRTCRGDRVRKRRCADCGGRFSTAERITVEYMQVRKRNGKVEQFSRAKLRQGLLRAVAGLGIPLEEVDAFVARVVEILQPDAPDIPVPSKEIGDIVLQQMQTGAAVTEVARIRFAIAFLGSTTYSRGFRGLDDFLEWLELAYGPARVAASEDTPSSVSKREGGIERFAAGKLSASIVAAAKGRGTQSQINSLAHTVVSRVVEGLAGQALVTSQQVAAEALKALREHDAIAYLRYAASVKRYQSVDDFWLEALGVRGLRDRG